MHLFSQTGRQGVNWRFQQLAKQIIQLHGVNIGAASRQSFNILCGNIAVQTVTVAMKKNLGDLYFGTTKPLIDIFAIKTFNVPPDPTAAAIRTKSQPGDRLDSRDNSIGMSEEIAVMEIIIDHDGHCHRLMIILHLLTSGTSDIRIKDNHARQEFSGIISRRRDTELTNRFPDDIDRGTIDGHETNLGRIGSSMIYRAIIVPPIMKNGTPRLSVLLHHFLIILWTKTSSC